MDDLFTLRAYGVLGYSMTMALAIACTSVGFAYYRAGRDKLRSAMFMASSFFFAMLFGYLVLVSIEPPWLNRAIMQPIMRTVAIAGAGCGWAYFYLILRKEAQQNGTQRQPPQSQHTLQGN